MKRTEDVPIWANDLISDATRLNNSYLEPLGTFCYLHGVKSRALLVEPAEFEDVNAAQRLVSDARQWLRARSIDQWQDPIPDAVIRDDVEQGRLFVVRKFNSIVAMVTISETDEETWGPTEIPALYIHRLAVAQDYRGEGLGGKLLRWTFVMARARDLTLVRLDCAAGNPGLRRFYEREGFEHVRDVAVPALDDSRMLRSSLYERSAGDERA